MGDGGRALSEAAAIAGIGYTPFSRDSGVSTTTLACAAILEALADAGLGADDVDGIATHRVGDSAPPWVVGPALGSTTRTGTSTSSAAAASRTR